MWWPNVALTYFVVFAAGVAYGAAVGASVGLLAMVATNLLLTGLHPVLLVNSPAMALLGALGGWLSRFVDFGQRGEGGALAAGVAALAGALATVLFSVAADLASWALFLAPSGASTATLRVLVLAGLAFNAVPALVNVALFAGALAPTLRALRAAGLLPAPPAQAPPEATPSTAAPPP